MSTYFFKTTATDEDRISGLTPQFQKMQQNKEIEKWNVIHDHPQHLIEIETLTLSPEEVKHKIREAGVDVEFTKAPGAK